MVISSFTISAIWKDNLSMKYIMVILILSSSLFYISAQTDETCSSQLVFSSNMSGDFDIYMIDVPDVGEIASDFRQLTKSEGTDTYPRWSPDGQSIVYQNDDFDLIFINDEGSILDEFIEPNTVDLAPTWNQSGNIAFISSNGVETVIGIYLPWFRDFGDPPEGMQRLFYRQIDEVRKNFPDWASEQSDGQSLIALEADWDGNPDIWLYLPDVDTRENLTNTDYAESSPAWSPDSTQLAYMSWETGNSEIWVMDVETREINIMTDFGEFAGTPRWSPNGEHIVFSGNSIFEPESDLDLYIMDVDSGNVRKITDFEGNEGLPDWRPCISDIP